MYQTTMILMCRLKILICSWTLVVFMSGINCLDGHGDHLSMEDVLLLKHEPDPKCFTQLQNGWERDFTCFFESPDNRTYDFFYTARSRRKCNTSVQRTREGTFLHICSFPRSEIMLFVDILLNVVDRNSSAILFNRKVYVEDNILLHQPISESLNQNGHAGQLQISWRVNTQCRYEMYYKIQYMSKSIGVKTKQGEGKSNETLVDLVPGEEVEAQVSVKCANAEDAGHWSRWSNSVKATVPQTADDISLMCYTSDLYNITCQWDGSRYSVQTQYKLFYKMALSDALGWTQWTECLPGRDMTDLCCFHGDISKKVKVKLTSSPPPHSRTFYSEEFDLAHNIKTPPPNHVKIVPGKAKMCMNWEAPLPSLSDHLLYELSYKRGVQEWMTVSLKKNATCTEVPSGSQISFKVRAKPDGDVFSGHWSEWTDMFTKDAPTDISTLLIQCSPVMLLVIAVIIFYLFFTYFRKLKQIFWPPVPNLDKVLQDFLMDINVQKWDPPITAKQCFEEITSSIVEVTSKEEDSQSEMSSEVLTELLSTPETLLSSGEQVDGGLTTETEIFPDYVTLNRDNEILSPKENNYVYKQVEEKEGPEVKDEVLTMTSHCSCTDESLCIDPCLCPVFLNHSYLPLTTDHIDCKVNDSRGTGNIYTNLPCS
ncbi:thrombopoietin receptor isoform X2 [Sphaeramia orbicularis]|uniref:Fibronectin type-III domain-containing protein n=1 Tax=Sphaeramia orbicularis TaxID=375764 RepID=A0A673C345_9TELE|nr:thrombopoietin receptor isoform X2 [Sphaeramia orbicularis]